MNETYMKLAELLKHESDITGGVAAVLSALPLKLEFNGTEITENIFLPAYMSLSVPEFSSELGELQEFLEELLLSMQLSRGDSAAVLIDGENTIVLGKISEAA